MFKSTEYTIEFKRELLRMEKSVNFSDFDSLQELGCLASLADDQDKLNLFLKYTGLGKLEQDNGKFLPSNEALFNVKELEASSKHFYNQEN